jgi:tetratricopeptide (TPR) repeat protein
MSISQVDSLVNNSLGQSKLDSVLGKYRILILKNDWPFSETKSVEYMLNLFNMKDFIDSTAVKVIDNKISWEQAHRDIASYYVNKQEYKKFMLEMNTLIMQYPFVKEYYSYASEQLLGAKLFDEALTYLEKGFISNPNAFYSKWLGIISLSKNKTDDAVHYLEKSKEFSNSDPQVLYNLAGAYSRKEMYTEALQTIISCLQINPTYPMAENLKKQLQAVLLKRTNSVN